MASYHNDGELALNVFHSIALPAGFTIFTKMPIGPSKVHGYLFNNVFFFSPQKRCVIVSYLQFNSDYNNNSFEFETTDYPTRVMVYFDPFSVFLVCGSARVWGMSPRMEHAGLVGLKKFYAKNP